MMQTWPVAAAILIAGAIIGGALLYGPRERVVAYPWGHVVEDRWGGEVCVTILDRDLGREEGKLLCGEEIAEVMERGREELWVPLPAMSADERLARARARVAAGDELLARVRARRHGAHP